MAWLGQPTQGEETRASKLQAWVIRQHPLALVSAVLSVISLLDFGVLFLGVPSIGAGIVALRQLAQKRSAAGGDAEPGRRAEGSWLAWMGIVLGALSLVAAALIYLRVFG